MYSKLAANFYYIFLLSLISHIPSLLYLLRPPPPPFTIFPLPRCVCTHISLSHPHIVECRSLFCLHLTKTARRRWTLVHSLKRIHLLASMTSHHTHLVFFLPCQLFFNILFICLVFLFLVSKCWCAPCARSLFSVLCNLSLNELVESLANKCLWYIATPNFIFLVLDFCFVSFCFAFCCCCCFRASILFNLSGI